MKEGNLILQSALNTYSNTAPISALAIKCINEQMELVKEKDLLPKMLKRKMHVKNRMPVKHYNIPKSCGVTHEYRKSAAPSALSALMEALFFKEYSENTPSSSSVYSYKLPDNPSISSRNFEYYYKNYAKMNEDIRLALDKYNKDSVLIIDIKAFYSCIDVKAAVSIFNGELPKSIENSFEEEGGLPIGLDISHLIAQKYMRQFDDILRDKFGGCYFRYVDDISIVCNKEEKGDVLAIVENTLPSRLVLNKEKLGIVSKGDWQYFTNEIAQRNKLDNLARNLYLFVCFNNNVEEYKHLLQESGYYLPFFRYGEYIKSNKFNRWFNALKKGGFRILYDIFRWQYSDLLNFLKNRKLYHLKEIDFTLADWAPQDNPKSIKTRFKVQNIKFHLSNLMHLMSENDLWSLKEKLPEHDDLTYFKLIIETLDSQNFDEIIKYESKHVTTLAEMWLSRGKPVKEVNFLNLESLDDCVENIIYLYLAGVINFNPADLKAKFKEPEHFRYIASFFENSVEKEYGCDYFSEMEAIFSCFKREELNKLLFSELDINDIPTLYALESGSY